LATVTQSFLNGTITHESWHDTINRSVFSVIFGELERWAHEYASGLFNPADKAEDQRSEDMRKAIAVCNNKWVLFNLDKSIDPAHNNAGFTQVGDTFVSFDDNWGSHSSIVASDYKPTFTTTPGRCR